MNSVTNGAPPVWKLVVDFPRHVARHFIEDQCVRTAAALSFTTLLSLVPLLAVMLVTLSAFPLFREIQGEVKNFLFSSFAPGVSDAVFAHLESFSEKAAGLRVAGLAVLLFTALSMMSTIEGAFNHIWHVRTARRFRTRFPIYWAVLTLGPMLVGMGFAATTYIVSLPFVSEFEANLGIKQKFFIILPFLFETLAFALMYMLIPNRPVRIRHAVLGGLFAGCLFEMAKRGFTYYLTHFPTQEAIYGAFASIPILLLWIYLSWVVVLLGAVVVRTLSIYRFDVDPDRPLEEQQLRCMLRVVGYLWTARQASHSVTLEAIQAQEKQMSPELLEKMVQRLEKAQWLTYTEDGELVLLGDLGKRTLEDLVGLVPEWYRSGDELKAVRDDWDQRLTDRLGHYRTQARESLAVPLRSLFEESD